MICLSNYQAETKTIYLFTTEKKTIESIAPWAPAQRQLDNRNNLHFYYFYYCYFF
jgi:hypothetical protein